MERYHLFSTGNTDVHFTGQSAECCSQQMGCRVIVCDWFTPDVYYLLFSTPLAASEGVHLYTASGCNSHIMDLQLPTILCASLDSTVPSPALIQILSNNYLEPNCPLPKGTILWLFRLVWLSDILILSPSHLCLSLFFSTHKFTGHGSASTIISLPLVISVSLTKCLCFLLLHSFLLQLIWPLCKVNTQKLFCIFLVWLCVCFIMKLGVSDWQAPYLMCTYCIVLINDS